MRVACNVRRINIGKQTCHSECCEISYNKQKTALRTNVHVSSTLEMNRQNLYRLSSIFGLFVGHVNTLKSTICLFKPLLTESDVMIDYHN